MEALVSEENNNDNDILYSNLAAITMKGLFTSTSANYPPQLNYNLYYIISVKRKKL